MNENTKPLTAAASFQLKFMLDMNTETFVTKDVNQFKM
jgi:hypothetical protein